MQIGENKSTQNISLSWEQLKEYMKMLLDLEKNIYIQEETLKKLNNVHNSLAIPQTIDVPQKAERDASIIASCFCTAFVTTILSVIIIFFIEFSNGNHNFTLFTIVIPNFITCAVIALLKGLLIGLISGIVLGSIIGIIWVICDKRKINKEYDLAMENYYFEISEDEKRVNQENIQKNFILHEIAVLKQKNDETRQRLAELYNYDILIKDYRNIVAVSSIYGYLRKGICKCLEYNDKTGDDGAYKTFEMELRLNKIITNTDIIIQKLDVVIKNQKDLQLTMEEATSTINRLVTNTNNISKSLGNIGNSIERLELNSEIAIYNQNQNNSELKYMNFMNDVYRKY